ncbi:MAG: hypothetical protein C4519_14865 [Desulfobacteraceae bacterium]|nr:MAG: hypothetical protein C4519_14865 [Desulfobacteraceae bacterium]
MTKDQHRDKLMIYLGNPENEWLSKMRLSTEVLGFSQENQIHKIFTPDELREIEMEALELRRQKYSRLVGLVDLALLKKAAEGDVGAAKLCYQRFENWSERRQHEFEGGVIVQVVKFGLDGKEGAQN